MAVDTKKDGNRSEAVSESEMQKSATEMRDRPIPANREPGFVNWAIVYHRIEETKAGNPNCKCAKCKPYMLMMEEVYWKSDEAIARQKQIDDAYWVERRAREAKRK